MAALKQVDRFRVTLTRQGRTVIDAALRDHVANEARLLSAMTASQRKQFEDLLRTLLLAHENPSEEAPSR